MSPGDLVSLNRLATLARLLSGVAHELNNALQVIGGTVELLEDRDDLPEPAVKGLQRVRNQNTRAAGVVSEVLAFTRQRADTVGKVSVREIASRAIALRTFAISRAGLTIALEAADGRVQVQGSTLQLQQLLLNLIANAEQALAGQTGGSIRVVIEPAGEDVVVRVIDNGSGVSPDIRDRLFEPFVTTRPRPDAVGLGLAAARAIAEAHGGSLILEDGAPGASFVLRLPAVSSEPATSDGTRENVT